MTPAAGPTHGVLAILARAKARVKAGQRTKSLAREPVRPAALNGSGRPCLVSLLVSFSYVRNRSARTTEVGQPRSQTVMTHSEPSRADLESVWGQQSLTIGSRATE
jgi:hypothetical protein